MSNYMRHFSHDQHDLELSKYSPALSCTICNGLTPKGEIVYVCNSCNWWFCSAIHQKCAKFPQHITSHPLHAFDHDHHSLINLTKKTFNNNDIRCDYCDKTFSAGEYYAYTCHLCPNFHMHASCGAVPLPALIDSPSNDQIVRFACHDQIPMALRGDLSQEHDHGHDHDQYYCFACQSPPRPGPVYFCASSQQCPNFFHKSCGDRLLRRIDHHPFHPGCHSLSLRVSKPRVCDSCCRKNCRLIYGCSADGCDFIMCTECASYDSALVDCRSHDHLLSLVEKACCDDIHCDSCQTSYAKKWVDGDVNVVPDEVRRTESLVFRCMEKECRFDLHFLCGPLPVRVEYEYHVHPLVLVNASSVKDGDCDEYYCDACEEERDPQFRVYYCGDCDYVAHIHCILFQIMKVIKGDSTKNVQLRALGEERWDFGIESVNVDQDTKENQEMTMRDIMKTLTEDELRRLAYPFTLDPESWAASANRYHYYRDLSSEFIINLEDPIENIDGVKQLFQVNTRKFENFVNEVWYFLAPEGLKLDDKYLRQKVEDVEGYKVPKTLAPILRKLFYNHKVLRREEQGLTLGMKSVTAALLCIVMDKMCRTKFEDVTRDDLRQWCFYLDGIRKIGGFYTERYRELLLRLTVPSFLGNEAIRCQRETRKKLTREMETLEAKLKRCKENYRELEKCAAEPSDFMKNWIRNASELKGKYSGDDLLGRFRKSRASS